MKRQIPIIRLIAAFSLIIFAAAALFAGGNSEEATEPATDGSQQAEAQPEGSQSEETEASDPGTIIDLSDDTKFVATVNGVGILRSDYELVLQQTQQQYAMQGQQITEAQLPQLQQNVLDQMVAEELLYQQGINSGFEASTESIDLQIQQIKGQFETEEQYASALQQNQTTEEELRSDIERNLVVQQTVQTVTADLQPVTDEEVQTFYDENPQFFANDEQIAARHILISTEGLESDEAIAEARSRAEDIRQELLDGADFAEVAEQKSEGPSGPRGGDLGTFGRGRMVPAFEEVAFSLAEGDISQVVETQFGFHIIQVTDKIEAGTVPVEEVTQDIRQYLSQEKQAEALDSYVSELRDNANIAINEEL